MAKRLVSIFAFLSAVALMRWSASAHAAPRAAAKAPSGGRQQFDPKLLATGRSLYLNRCGRCHKLHRPVEYSPEQWARIVPKMAKRSGLKPDQRDAVIAYLSSQRAR